VKDILYLTACCGRGPTVLHGQPLQQKETLCEGRTAVLFLQQLRGVQVPLHIRIPGAHPRTSALTQAILQGAWQRRGVPLFAHTPPDVQSRASKRNKRACDSRRRFGRVCKGAAH